MFAPLKQIGKKNCLTENAGFDLTIPGQPDTVLAPDIAVIATPTTRGSGYRKTPPLLAVEIVSPSQSKAEMLMKAQFYLSAGVQIVWIVWPDSRTVDVWTASQQVTTLTERDTIDGGTVLPGYSCPVGEFFP